jgi:hypothetical protein
MLKVTWVTAGYRQHQPRAKRTETKRNEAKRVGWRSVPCWAPKPGKIKSSFRMDLGGRRFSEFDHQAPTAPAEQIVGATHQQSDQ